MRCKIERTQKLMWHNIMRSTKSQKTSILHYSIDFAREQVMKKKKLVTVYALKATFMVIYSNSFLMQSILIYIDGQP